MRRKTPETAVINARDLTSEMRLCKRPSVAYYAKRTELIVSRDQRRTTAKSTLQSAVVRVTMPSEGTESDDNTVLARGVTSKT